MGGAGQGWGFSPGNGNVAPSWISRPRGWGWGGGGWGRGGWGYPFWGGYPWFGWPGGVPGYPFYGSYFVGNTQTSSNPLDVATRCIAEGVPQIGANPSDDDVARVALSCMHTALSATSGSGLGDPSQNPGFSPAARAMFKRARNDANVSSTDSYGLALVASRLLTGRVS